MDIDHAGDSIDILNKGFAILELVADSLLDEGVELHVNLHALQQLDLGL